jgi:uncharacterized alpha-E superfamily protein
VAFAVRRLREAAYPVRDQLSQDTWLVLGALERELFGQVQAGGGRGSGRLARALSSLLAFGGLTADMVRDQGRRFLDAGRSIERALGTCMLLRATLSGAAGPAGGDPEVESLLLESVLTAGESIITYRRRHRMDARRESVLELLLLDPENPRSVAYQIDRLTESVGVLARRERVGALTGSERLVLEASTTLRLAVLSDLADVSADGAALTELLNQLVRLLERAADALDAEHFTHLLPQRSLVTSAAQAAGGAHLRLV